MLTYKVWSAVKQVLVDTPTPPQTSKDSYYEDTMLLLDMVREKRQKENQEKKVWVKIKFECYNVSGCKNQSYGP